MGQLGVLALLGLLFCAAAAELPSAAIPSALAARGPRGADLVCAECHASQIATLQAGAHASGAPAGLDEAYCARCHGDCTKHADSSDPADVPRGFTYQKQDAVTLGCSACHARAIEEVHHWSTSDHLASGKRCLDCHRVHRAREKDPQAQHPAAYATFAALAESAAPAGTKRCTECHATKGRELGVSAHAALLESEGCEICHGEGSLHAEGLGTKRHILRPDRRAKDANAGCRTCHAEVHPTRFHWPERERQLGRDLACATCHRIHWDASSGRRAGLWIEKLRGSATPAETNRR